ncbi:hypothetical protein F0L68_05420 [Solihabitans fulvus]|uniref:Uncharacterized protein n=1 Tax=Solihabitans fulvus TaxID=1892852 RepID=A0A5B2XQG2_9PSEU|nr:hypothetical protein [Solihabitans fulvus]KAA2265101.1 hypothetical protein F0L68_05420 [Solihabitans fulvus]
MAAEIATLAYTWRQANLGPEANERDAQHWHDRWRPAFAARITDWASTDGLDGDHRVVDTVTRDEKGARP